MLDYIARVVRAHGFTVDNIDPVDHLVDTPEATFAFDIDGVGVIMWSGSYPFATDHDMGVLPSPEEAVRYASWLLKREDFYQRRDEAILTGEVCLS